MTEIKFTGLREAKRDLEKIERQVERETKKALRIEAELIMTQAKQKFVPVDLGALRRSGKVDPVKQVGREVYVELSFGDNAVDYAAAVHEHPSAYSPPSWRGKSLGQIQSVRSGQAWNQSGRGPKYLERPMRAAEKTLDEKIAARVDRAIR